MNRMYKCVLADDEPLDLMGLRQLIERDSLGIDVVCSASSGFDALDYLRQESADILITDIRMPIMSGLELARQAVRLHPRIKLIFISGYKDFEYARNAIDLSAAGYILKPIDDDQLLEFLRKLRVRMDQEKERLALERTIPLIRNELLIHWLEGKGEPEQLAALLQRSGWEERPAFNRVALAEIDDVNWKLNAYPKERRAAIIRGIHRDLADQCKAHRLFPVQVDDHRIAMLYRENEHNARDYQSAFESMVSGIDAKFPVTVTIVTGERVANAEHIPFSYRSAFDALTLKMFVGKNRVIASGAQHHGLVKEGRNVNEVLGELFAAMSGYALVRIDDCLQTLFAVARGLGEKLQVYHFSLHVIAALEQYLLARGEDLYALLGIEFSNLDVLYKFETIADIQSWLRRRLFEISEKLHLKQMGRNGKLVEEMMKYVEEHIADSFTLKDVARSFSFSPNYLGHLFKKDTGENFSDYVLRVRMDKARELLRDPKRKIYEVASEVGYKNFTVFNRHFRKSFGLSPSDYRKRH